MCLLKRILPFTLALMVSLISVTLSHRLGARKTRAQAQAPVAGVAHSRTWLIIRSQSPPAFPKEAYTEDKRFSIQLRVRLDANGTVSDVIPQMTTLPANYTEAIIAAAKRAKFTPPTEDGKPLPVLADMECGLGLGIAGEYYDRRGRKRGFHTLIPYCSKPKLITIEGAKDSEGWRVIYE
ncbi:MAG: hypothetical protein ACJ74W_06250 [Pyrinomonadaceae bacterium]